MRERFRLLSLGVMSLVALAAIPAPAAAQRSACPCGTSCTCPPGQCPACPTAMPGLMSIAQLRDRCPLGGCQPTTQAAAGTVRASVPQAQPTAVPQRRRLLPLFPGMPRLFGRARSSCDYSTAAKAAWLLRSFPRRLVAPRREYSEKRCDRVPAPLHNTHTGRCAPRAASSVGVRRRCRSDSCRPGSP